MNIADFLKARITEDERAARDASPGPWSYPGIDTVSGGMIYDPTVSIASVEWDTERVDARIRRTRPDWQADATGKHIARHDPARVMAECKAKRRVIGSHRDANAGFASDESESFCETCHDYYEHAPAQWPCPTLKAIAAVYSDHPDYRQEWALTDS